jgi:hypothetical protein
MDEYRNLSRLVSAPADAVTLTFANNTKAESVELRWSKESRRPLTFEELKRAVKRITYKKDWEITLYEGGYGLGLDGIVTLRVTIHNVVDTYTGKVAGPLTGRESAVSPFYTLDKFYEWAWQSIRKVELHEAQEWFKVDGELTHNPHRSDGGTRGQYTETMVDPGFRAVPKEKPKHPLDADVKVNVTMENNVSPLLDTLIQQAFTQSSTPVKHDLPNMQSGILNLKGVYKEVKPYTVVRHDFSGDGPQSTMEEAD